MLVEESRWEKGAELGLAFKFDFHSLSSRSLSKEISFENFKGSSTIWKFSDTQALVGIRCRTDAVQLGQRLMGVFPKW